MAEKGKLVTLIYEPSDKALFFAPLTRGDTIQVPESEAEKYFKKGIWKTLPVAKTATAKTKGGE